MAHPAPLPPGLARFEKAASLGGLLKRVALGKNLRPSELALARKYVTESGFAKNRGGGLLRSLLIGGKDAHKVIGARYAQGGFFGRGGLLRGELAPDPSLIASVKRMATGKGLPTLSGVRPGGRPYLNAGDGLRTAGLGANYALHLGLGLGIPYMGVRQALKSDDTSGAGRSLGEGAGYLLAGPLGLAGIVGGSILGGEAGARTAQAVSSLAPSSPSPTLAPLPGNYGSLNSQLAAYAQANPQIDYY